jgi:predicted GNAT family acetyltransferase
VLGVLRVSGFSVFQLRVAGGRFPRIDARHEKHVSFDRRRAPPYRLRRNAMVDVVHNAAASRFESVVDGVLCVLEYSLHEGVMTITHTGVPEAVGGRGIAGALAAAAFEAARHERWRVVPACAYVEAWIKRHPEYADLVDPA